MKKSFVVLAGLVVLPLVVAAGAVEWAWREAKVDTRGGYVVLLHGSGNADPRELGSRGPCRRGPGVTCSRSSGWWT